MTVAIPTMQSAPSWDADRQMGVLCADLEAASAGLQLVIPPIKDGVLNLSLGMASNDRLRASLQEASEAFLNKLCVYNCCLAPVTRETLDGLVFFLDTYVDTGFDQFVALLPALRDELPIYSRQATAMQALYEEYCIELDGLSQEVDRNLAKFELDMQCELKRVEKKMKKAEDVKRGYIGLGALGMGGAIVLACGLLGPGGLLFAPALAPLAAAGGGTGAALCVAAGNAHSDSKRAKAVALQHQVSAANSVRDHMKCSLPGAIQGMQDVGRIMAEFFDALQTKLDTLDRQAATADRALQRQTALAAVEALVGAMRRQMGAIKHACVSYTRVSGDLRIALGSIQRLTGQQREGYALEWLREKTEKGVADQALLRRISPTIAAKALPAAGSR